LKYGPLIFEAIKHGREPAERAVRRALARQAERRRAFAHAKTLVDGSVLRAYHQGEPVWVVFSGETPVTAYPAGVAELSVLLEHANLDQRVRPQQLSSKLSELPRKLSTLPRRLPAPPWRR
jgi:hypothetical protein